MFISISYRVSPEEVTNVGDEQYLTANRIFEASRAAAINSPREIDRVWLARDRYLRTLCPVAVSEIVTLLVSLEVAGPSSVRVCVRAIGRGRSAVACAFETMGCLTPSGDDAPLPPSILEKLRAYAEQPGADGVSFATRAVAGGASVASLFPDHVLVGGGEPREEPKIEPLPAAPEVERRPTIRSSVIFRASTTTRPSMLGTSVRTGEYRSTESPRRSGLLGPIPEFAAPVIPEKKGGIAFVFPGVEGYDGQLLRELYAALPYFSAYVDEADVVARRHFRSSFFRLVDADSIAVHDEHLEEHPELAQLGAFVSGVLFAEALQERGIRPDVLVGDGLGELAALTIGGAFDITTGLEIVAQRARAQRALQSRASSPVLPHPSAELERLLERFDLRSPRVQVYSAFASALQDPDRSPHVLASYLLQPSDFHDAVRALRRAGCEYFVECGAGALTRVIGEVLGGKPTPTADPPRRKSLGVKLLDASNVIARRAAVAPDADANGRTTMAGVRPTRIGERVSPAPAAITGIGCVLPGARDVESYWRNVLAGATAIRDREPFATEAWEIAGLRDVDGVASASVDDIDYDARLPYTRAEFEHLTTSQRLLALALRQCADQLRAGASQGRRVRCILAASTTGMREYEERSLVDTVRERLASLDEPASLREAITASFETLVSPILSPTTPCASLGAVIERFANTRVDDVTLVDAACASSLYAVDLGMKALSTGETDLVIVGGVFAPGASWQPLYALFEGILGSGAFPYDRRADGVVFGEGAVVLVLERLSAVLDAGSAQAVICGVGLSCDGKKASVSEPSVSGQALAMRRALENAGVERESLQLIEGHGVSNPAADAAEIEALQNVFADAEATLPRRLESVKSLIGHTMWASGAASLAKVARAVAHQVVPVQSHASPNPTAQLERSGFELPTDEESWPSNEDDQPRRAGVSACGLGGTNAHAIIEAFAPAYHRQVVDSRKPEIVRAPMAVVAVAGMFPGADEHTLMDHAGPWSGTFQRSTLRSSLPAELRAEVVDQLDISQLIAVAGVEKALSRLARWEDSRERTGVIAGLVGGTERSSTATERVYRDELHRLLVLQADASGVAREDAERVARALHENVGAMTPPLSAHSLMGLLPNIASARVGNLFDLHGPNLVIDADGRSIPETLDAAERWLTCGTADVMLVCLLRVNARRALKREPEGALVLGLTTPQFARDRGWTFLGELVVAARGKDTVLARPALATRSRVEVKLAASRPMAGLDEIARAIEGAPQGKATVLRWERDERGATSSQFTATERRPQAMVSTRTDAPSAVATE